MMKSFLIIWLSSSVFMAFTASPPSPETKCPVMCNCESMVVECRVMKLRKVPAMIPPGTVDLDLSSNLISVIENSSFVGLTSLTRLTLSKNAIKYIDTHAFADLGELRFLDLSNNDLAELNAGHLSPLQMLTKLRIGWNPLLNVTQNVFQSIPSVMEIDADGNLFSYLYDFSNLKSLKIINLAECRVRQFFADNFRRLPRLQQLKLSWNSLEELPADVLRDLGGLQKLQIDNNLIRSLEKYDFNVNANLTSIDLTNNELQSLEGVQMGQLSHLTSVNLSSNYIQVIPEVLLIGIPKDSLLLLLLDGNPLNCDCRMKSLVNLAETTAFHFTGRCGVPKSLATIDVWRVDQKKLLCAPKMRKNTARSKVATSGDPVKMTCPLEGDPSPEITWYYHNQSTSEDEQVSESFIQQSPDGAQVVYDEVTFGRSGLYTCQGTNAKGSVNVSLALAVVPKYAMVLGESVSCPSGTPLLFIFVLLMVIAAAVFVTCLIYRKYIRALRAQRNVDYSSLRENEGVAM